jgi:hypothetical protein
VRLLAHWMRKVRRVEPLRCSFGRSPEREPSAEGSGALKALESCRATAGMQLRPSKLRVPSHKLDMDLTEGLSRARSSAA